MLIAFATMTALLGLLLIQKYQTRRAPGGSGPYLRTRAALTVYVIAMWVMAAITFSLLALMAVVTGTGGFRVAGAFAVIVVLTVLAGMSIGGWLWMRASAEPDDTPADTTPDECWKWGEIDYNPNDPTVMVEKRLGIGYTFNFARWQSWLILGGFFVVTIG